jgi:hypothetical protein
MSCGKISSLGATVTYYHHKPLARWVPVAMSYQLGDAVRPNSAKINAVEWAIDVSLTACLFNSNGVQYGVADVGAAAKPAAGLTRQQPCPPANRRQVEY